MIYASFFYPAAGLEKGSVLLFHGITGTPNELAELAVDISNRGYRVIVPCLAGHGSDFEKLGRVPLKQWLNEVECACNSLSGRAGVNFIGGLSFGALLALYGLLHHQELFDGGILLSPSMRLRTPKSELLLRILSLLPEPALNHLWSIKKLSRPDHVFRVEPMSYDRHSVGAVARLMKLRLEILKQCKSITKPIIVIQDPHDHHLSPLGAERLVERVSAPEADLIWVPHGQHELTLGHSYDTVRSAILAFIDRVGG